MPYLNDTLTKDIVSFEKLVPGLVTLGGRMVVFTLRSGDRFVIGMG